MKQSVLDELVGFVKRADNYTQDTKNWPDPTEPRAAKPPDPKGCTCLQGEKLNCPIHGLNADPEQEVDHTWSIPQGQPIGYPQDQPRNWTQAVSSFSPDASHKMIAHSESEDSPPVGQFSDVVRDFIPSWSVRKQGSPFHQALEDGVHGLSSDSVDLKAFFGEVGDDGDGDLDEVGHDLEHIPVEEPQIADDVPAGGHEAAHDSDHVEREPDPEHHASDQQSYSAPTQYVERPEPIHQPIIARIEPDSRSRKLVIHRDEFGRMAAIEEVYV